MSKTLKRLLSLMLALIMVFSLFLAVGCSKDKDDDDDDDDDAGGNKNAAIGRDDFISDIGGVSETFAGAVSKESYVTREEAAQAFVSTEVVGEKEAVILETTSQGELSQNEIDELNIPSDILAGADSVEKVEVTYKINDNTIQYGVAKTLSASTATKDTLNTEKTVVVYVIKCGTDWKYFAPLPVTGETISKSYYDSVFNSEKYANCTVESTTSVKAKIFVSIQGETESMDMAISVYQLIKHADKRVYLEQRITQTMDKETDTETLYAYMEEDEYGYVTCYIKEGENSTEWIKGSLYQIGFSRLEELRPFYDQYLDYTYFTKTNFGFALADENAQKYFTAALADALEGFSHMINEDAMDVDMYAEYYVSDGVLSGVRTDASVNIDISEQGAKMTLDEDVLVNTTCKDYGTTVVEKPFVE